MSPYRTPPRRSRQDHFFERHVVWPDWLFVVATALAATFVALLTGCAPAPETASALAHEP